MQTRERAHCARSVFPFIYKKKKVLETIIMSRENVVGSKMNNHVSGKTNSISSKKWKS